MWALCILRTGDNMRDHISNSLITIACVSENICFFCKLIINQVTCPEKFAVNLVLTRQGREYLSILVATAYLSFAKP